MKPARPFAVSTFGLSPDMQRIHPEFGNIKRGEVSRQTLFEVLEMYRRIETDWGTLASRIAIQSDTGRFIVRVSGRQLMLGLEGAPPAEAVPLAAEDIVTQVGLPPALTGIRPPPPPPEARWRIAVAVLLLVAAVALLIRALAPIFVPSGRPEDDIALVSDPVVENAQLKALAGMFATGQQPGDRRMLISANGFIELAEFGPRQRLGSGGDTFRIGRRENETCLVTSRSGIIEVIDSNRLRYFGDTYRRLE